MSSSECCSNPPILSPSSGEGTVQVIGGFKSYVAGSPDSKLSILLISDVYGYEAPKLRKLADKVAKSGFYVVVPDFLYGDPYVAEKDTERPLHVWIKDHLPAKGCEDTRVLIAALKSKGVLAIGAAGFCWGDKVAKSGFYVVVPDFLYGDPYVAEKDTERPLHVWIKDHLPAKGCEDTRVLIAALKSKGVLAIGAAGFCWGGMVVTKLAKFDDIQAGVLLHPGPLNVDDINEVKIPIAILGAETDSLSPPEQLKQFGEILSAKPIDSYVKIFPGVVHGWTVRYKDEDEFVVKSAQEAHSEMLNWLSKYLK